MGDRDYNPPPLERPRSNTPPDIEPNAGRLDEVRMSYMWRTPKLFRFFFVFFFFFVESTAPVHHAIDILFPVQPSAFGRDAFSYGDDIPDEAPPPPPPPPFRWGRYGSRFYGRNDPGGKLN